MKYAQSGRWNTSALTLASGPIIMPSVSRTPTIFRPQSCGANRPNPGYEGIRVQIRSGSWWDADLRESTAASLRRLKDDELEEAR